MVYVMCWILLVNKFTLKKHLRQCVLCDLMSEWDVLTLFFFLISKEFLLSMIFFQMRFLQLLLCGNPLFLYVFLRFDLIWMLHNSPVFCPWVGKWPSCYLRMALVLLQQRKSRLDVSLIIHDVTMLCQHLGVQFPGPWFSHHIFPEESWWFLSHKINLRRFPTFEKLTAIKIQSTL